ncbi:hypothetical protein GCM10020254_88470 [Streptomyces goshikiensis]
MNETQGTPAPDTSTPPEPQQLLRIARTAAELAVAAADHATEAVCRSRSGSTSRLEEVMHTAHTHAVEAEKCAGWAAGWETDDTAEYVLHRYVTSAVDAAIRAQSAAGVEVTATVLHSQLEQPPTAQEHAERESERRREEAEEEAAERAATGMDKDNRHQARMNDYYAESAVPQLGWTAGHVRVLEAAETGRLYWRDKQARQAARHGQWEGGRRVSSERTRALYGARFLIGARRDDGTRILALSPMGQVALELARLHPEGLYATDQEAYQARYDQVAKRYQRSDDKKAAARRLPPLYDGALRFYRRPVTLAEQELQAQRDAAEQWEDEGGCCPGVQTPRPAAEVAAEPTTPAARRSVTAAAPAGQELLRRLFAPRRTPEQARDPLRTVIRRPPTRPHPAGARDRPGRTAADPSRRPHHGTGRPGAQRLTDARDRRSMGARARLARPRPAHRTEVPVGLPPVVHVRTRRLLELPVQAMRPVRPPAEGRPRRGRQQRLGARPHGPRRRPAHPAHRRRAVRLVVPLPLRQGRPRAVQETGTRTDTRTRAEGDPAGEDDATPHGRAAEPGRPVLTAWGGKARRLTRPPRRPFPLSAAGTPWAPTVAWHAWPPGTATAGALGIRKAASKEGRGAG